MNVIFYIDTGRAGVEIDGVKYDAEDKFYECVDGVVTQQKGRIESLLTQNASLEREKDELEDKVEKQKEALMKLKMIESLFVDRD